MVPVLLRAAPWPAVLGLSAAGGATGVLAVVLHRGPALVLLQLGLVLLGGAASCALDEPAAAVVASCPVRRSTQVLVRALAAAVGAVVGAALVFAWWARSPVQHVLLLELLGCWVLGFALAVLARTRVDEPAEAVASGLVLVLLTVLLVNPIGRRIVLFPDDDQVARGVRTWWAVLTGCAVAVILVVRERHWRGWPGSTTPLGQDSAPE